MVAPVGTDLFGVESEDGTAEVGILCTDVEDGTARDEIDGRQENLRATCLTGSTDDFVAISGKLLAVQMAMGVYELQIQMRNEELGLRNDDYLLRWRSSSI